VRLSAKKAAMNLANATNLDRKCGVKVKMVRHRAIPQVARYPGQKKSGLSPTHFSVLLRSALKAKPKDKFVCLLRIRRFAPDFNASRPAGDARFSLNKEHFSCRL
jgi:hypothetical protein